MRLIALIDQPAVIRKILSYLGLPTEVPDPRPARAPPMPLDGPTGRGWAHDDIIVESDS